MHNELIIYVAWIFAIVLTLCGLLAQIGVDAHHWMPRSWRGLQKLKKKGNAVGGSEAGGTGNFTPTRGSTGKQEW
jgi:hypothetical protein